MGEQYNHTTLGIGFVVRLMYMYSMYKVIWAYSCTWYIILMIEYIVYMIMVAMEHVCKSLIHCIGIVRFWARRYSLEQYQETVWIDWHHINVFQLTTISYNCIYLHIHSHMCTYLRFTNITRFAMIHTCTSGGI